MAKERKTARAKGDVKTSDKLHQGMIEIWREREREREREKRVVVLYYLLLK